MTAMKSWDLVFTGPGQVEFRQEELPPPGPGEVQCRACLSLVSAGGDAGALPEAAG